MCSHRFKGDQGEFVISAPGSLSLAKKCHPFIKRLNIPSEDGVAPFDYDSVLSFIVFGVANINMEGAGFLSVKQWFWTLAVSMHLQSSQQPLNQNLKNSTIFRAPLGLNNQKRRMV